MKMKLHNTYFGFTNNKTALQAGKIEKSLDMLWNYDGKTYLRKVLVFELLQAGRKPELEENYSYYSAKIDDYTKPKTLYKLEDQEGTYIELNKTLYDYALYLVENDFINNDKAKQFIENEEHGKAEAQRLENEQIEKARKEGSEKRLQEQEERKQRLEQKRAEWRNNGTELLQQFNIDPITKLLDDSWKEVRGIYTTVSKDEFYTSMYDQLLILIGNQAACINNAQYHVENINSDYPNNFTVKSNPTRYFEKEILFSVFNINAQDGNRTITAKVKAVFENRSYKGGSSATKKPKTETFYKYNAQERMFVPVQGEKLSIRQTDLFIYELDDKYYINESQSGLMVAKGETKQQAKDNCCNRLENYKSKIETAIKQAISVYGISPLYRNEVSETVHE
jgi:hypothetical protein